MYRKGETNGGVNPLGASEAGSLSWARRRSLPWACRRSLPWACRRASWSARRDAGATQEVWRTKGFRPLNAGGAAAAPQP